MKITQDMIAFKAEEKLYFGDTPRYVFMDKQSYEEFNVLSMPKERYRLTSQNEEQPKIVKICVSVGVFLEIFSVDTDKDLFEVV